MVRARINTRKVRAVLRTAEPILARHIAQALDQHGYVFRNEMDKRFTATVTPGRRSSSLNLGNRTGRLRRSIGHQVVRNGQKVNGTKLAVFAGNSDTPYAAIQEFGGTIFPSAARKLAIPLPAAMTAAGVSRFSSPRALQGDPAIKTFILRSKAGNLLIVQRTPSGRIEPMYVLKDSVTLPARLRFGATFRSSKMQKDRVARLREAVQAALIEATQKGKTGG